MGLQVDADKAPLTVNDGAGKATNLDAFSPSGIDEFAFLCKEEDSDFEFRNVMISAIMLGEG